METFIIILIAVIAWIWYDGLKAHEIGLHAVRKACEAEGLQLLDGTISLVSLRPARDDYGRLALRRVYQFDFSDDGYNRRRGSLHLLGGRVALLNVGLRLAASDGELL
jgi:hypothetical protein